MHEVVIVDAVRTPVTKAHPEKGWFKDIRADELGIIVLKGLVRRTKLELKLIEDVILGCATQTGEQAMNIARYISIMAGLPFEVAAQTINRQCASSMTAVHSAAQAILSECGDVFIAGGIESMTHLPEGAGADLNPRRFEFFDSSASSMGLTAENLAAKCNISRREQEEYALRSHQKAVAAQDAGRFKNELISVEITTPNGVELIDRDQNPRSYTTLELMALMDPIAREGGTVTTATATPASDGAAALLIMSKEKSEELGYRPLARIVSMGVAGVDPKYMGLGMIPASKKALDRAGIAIGDIDIAEINEAFAVVAIIAIKELGIDESRVNPNGGTIAFGHPMGCTGARLITTLVHDMKRQQARYGLATMCVGMGQGAAIILERENN